MMTGSNWGALCALLAALSSCAAPRETAKVDPTLESFVLDHTPDSIEHRLFIDFGGKVHLLGYDLEPDGVTGPGSTIDLKLYWKCVDKLPPGWNLFTHLLNEYGQRIGNFDNAGPLRTLKADGNTQTLPPSDWEPGKFYVDEQRIGIPQYEATAPWSQNLTGTVTIVTGVWKDSTRLEVLSGSSDKENAGIVAHLHTGVQRPAALEQSASAKR